MSSQKTKKRKAAGGGNHHDANTRLDTSKPSAIFKPSHGRRHTLSIALPGSIIANAVTHDQKTALAGQIARACAVFCVDEIVIFDDGQAEAREHEQGGYSAFADPNFFLYHLLSYLETPPQLRKGLFPMHPDLRSAGTLPSIDTPHHLRSDEWCIYREGLAIRSARGSAGITGTLVDCGLRQLVFVPVSLESNTRVTVKLASEPVRDTGGPIQGEAVSPDSPREEAGYYWGYTVRQAASLSDVFTECPYDGGYDASIGTSERGATLASILRDDNEDAPIRQAWMHLLVVYGGVAGLEAALASDQQLLAAGIDDVAQMFDYWINLVPGQGSRTIRTEEAVWIGLMGLRPLVETRSAT